MLLEYFGFQDFGNEILLAVEIISVLLITVVLSKIISVLLKRSFREMSKNIKIDETQFVVLQRLVILVIYLLGIFIAASMIPGLSALGVSILASAGILAVVVGFAAQQAFSNVISGIFIAIFKPFRVGDKVLVDNEYGIVEDITLRHTIINTWKNIRIIIPNSKISDGSITNYSINDPKVLGTLEIGISYDSSIEKARKIMTEEAYKHPDLLKKVRGKGTDLLSKDELVKVRLVALTDFAQTMRLYYWAPDQSTAIKMKFDLMESIKKRFDKEGIEIPFPYRTIVYKKDLEKPKGS